jgi:hypothetical protein
MNDLDPTQSEAVRRALAAARHDQPIPAEVAARLDATLADLVAEQSAPVAAAAMAAPETTPEGARVLPFWRRRVPVILAAAATVVAAAVIAPQLINDSSGDSATTAGDASSPQVDGSTADATSPESADEPAPLSSELSTHGNTSLTRNQLAPGLLNALVDHDIRAVQPPMTNTYDNAYKDLGKTASQQDRTTDELGGIVVAQGEHLACGPTLMPRHGAIYSARYRGHAAIVFVAPASKDGVPVIVYDCAGDDPHVPVNAFTAPVG